MILIYLGTGLAVRDITPESVLPLLIKEATGISNALMSQSLKYTPFAMLSRPVTGILNNNVFILTLPGKPKACKENLDIVGDVLEHVVDQLSGGKTHPEILSENNSNLMNMNSISKENNSKPTNVSHQCIHHSDKIRNFDPHPDPLNTSIKNRSRQSPYPMVSIKDALDRIVSCTNNNTQVVSKNVQDLVNGDVLAMDVISNCHVPDFRASIVDGYAIIGIRFHHG